ncbi:MAG: TolC family protein [Acidobacteria bacterium]|nr:TolC family protein [Acidobacteriota bacterium]
MIHLALLFASALSAQDSLSVTEAARMALQRHPALQAESARIDAASQRIEQARAGRLPKVQYTESYQRSNNPVFVFSSLLTQRRFDDFRIDSLNHPGSVNNFQSRLIAEQPIYDAGVTKRQVAMAETQRKLTTEERRGLEMQLAAGAARAYYGALLAEQSLNVAREAVKSAEADLQRAETIRTAGLSTDADVLSIKVHLAAMREQEIRRRSDLEVARASLNDVLGLPLDTPHTLSSMLTPVPAQTRDRDSYEKSAKAERADLRRAALGIEMAGTQTALARAAYLPQVSLMGVLEADRGKFVTQGGGNWLAGVNLKWNLFNGYADRARIQEAVLMSRAATAQKQQLESNASLEVRRALAERNAATERITVAEASIAQAEESLRIIRNRYEGGLTTVTELLRNQVALLESRLRRLAAIHDQRAAATMLELAAGTLTPDSEVLK